MSDRKFGVDYCQTKSRAKCKQCLQVLTKGILRLRKFNDRGYTAYYHPPCIFETFSYSRKSSKIISDHTDIEGFDEIEETDQDYLKDLINECKRKKDEDDPADSPVAGPSSPKSCSSESSPGSPTSQVLNIQAAQETSQSWISRLQGTGSMGNLVGSSVGPIVISSDENDTEEGSSVSKEEPSSKKQRLDSTESKTSTSTSCEPKTTPDSDLCPTAAPASPKPPAPPEVQPPDPGDTYVCCVCLDPPVHPVKLPCNHIYCYLCAKGLVMADNFSVPLCSLCRREFSRDYLGSAAVLHDASQELNDTPPLEVTEAVWQWFYKGNNGWWRFEARNNEELEENYMQGKQSMTTIICGNLYTIDFVTMEQYQTSRPNKKRKIKRDLKSSDCKGVAGLVKRSWNRGTPTL